MSIAWKTLATVSIFLFTSVVVPYNNDALSWSPKGKPFTHSSTGKPVVFCEGG
jgi:hypothetical protein